MRLATRALLDYDGPAYMRLGRLAVDTVTDTIPGYTFELGKGATLKDGSDVTIIAVGMMVQMALKAASDLALEGISARVIDMHTIKPLDEALVLKAAQETGAIVTTEEANVLGRSRRRVCEYLSGVCPVPVIRHGVQDVFAGPARRRRCMEAYGPDARCHCRRRPQGRRLQKIRSICRRGIFGCRGLFSGGFPCVRRSYPVCPA